MEKWELVQKQSLPLEAKIIMTQQRIREWYDAFDGNVYVSFSGGKDSTVLLQLVRELYPEVPAVFADTGMEYPEIKAFVKTIDNVVWLRPKMLFNEVIEKYGYPVISKEYAEFIERLRSHPNDPKVVNKILHGIYYDGKPTMFKLPKKWHDIALNSPFKISSSCCAVMKKAPIKGYERKTKARPFIGTMADEAQRRRQNYLKTGCNAFDAKRPISTPLGFWRERDVLQYLLDFNLPYAKVYGDIVSTTDGGLTTTGAKRTGCMFCMFGVHLEKGENRFQRMARTHPKHYHYCINNLGLGVVLDYLKIDYNEIKAKA